MQLYLRGCALLGFQQASHVLLTKGFAQHPQAAGQHGPKQLDIQSNLVFTAIARNANAKTPLPPISTPAPCMRYQLESSSHIQK